MPRIRALATVLAAGGALCISACGTSISDYTCRDLSASAAKREAMADVIVVQIRTKQKVIHATAVERMIERRCAGASGERLAPDAKAYRPVLEASKSQAGV